MLQLYSTCAPNMRCTRHTFSICIQQHFYSGSLFCNLLFAFTVRLWSRTSHMKTHMQTQRPTEVKREEKMRRERKTWLWKKNGSDQMWIVWCLDASQIESGSGGKLRRAIYTLKLLHWLHLQFKCCSIFNLTTRILLDSIDRWFIIYDLKSAQTYIESLEHARSSKMEINAFFLQS